MNTFFPTLQLFFESGLSCTIDGGQLPDAIVGLDPLLRFRLTDCTYEEEGRMTKTIRPEKYSRSIPGILIKEAVIAQRTSKVMRSLKSEGNIQSSPPSIVTLAQEVHTVVGLRLEGMSKMAYIWATARIPTVRGDKIWGDVRIAGLRDDVPSPLSTFPMQAVKAGGEVALVAKESLISRRAKMETNMC